MERPPQPPGGVEGAVERYGDALFRLCLVMLGSDADAEDAVQETMVRYLQKAPAFADGDHERAWLLTVAKNVCRDMLRTRKRRGTVSLEALEQLSDGTFDSADAGVWEALMALPERFRLVLTLYYVEQYPIGDIARVIGRTPSAVKMRLQKGRRLLREAYGKERM